MSRSLPHYVGWETSRWVTYGPGDIRDDGLYGSYLKLTPPKETPLAVRQFITFLERQDAINPDFQSNWLYFYGMSKALASGPKVLRPTYEQCVALANCEANLSFAEFYEQPYPVVIIDLPQQWRQSKTTTETARCRSPGWVESTATVRGCLP